MTAPIPPARVPAETTSRCPARGPGGGGEISRSWRTCQGTLTHGPAKMTPRRAAVSGRDCRVEVTGDREQRDLVILTACSAFLARRRRDIAIVPAAGGSH